MNDCDIEPPMMLNTIQPDDDVKLTFHRAIDPGVLPGMLQAESGPDVRLELRVEAES